MEEQTKIIKVFIVEDHNVTRYGLRLMLQADPSFKVVGEAADGKVALTEIVGTAPDVALIDIGLPSMDGIALSQKVKEQSPATRIVMFTSRDSSDEVMAAFAAGADGYCLKEASESQLRMAVKSVAEGAMWIHPSVAQAVLGRSMTAPQGSARPKVEHKMDYDTLSEREHEVLRYMVAGMSNQQIAEELILSIETVKTHVRHIFEKLAVADRTQAALKAVRAGWVE